MIDNFTWTTPTDSSRTIQPHSFNDTVTVPEPPCCSCKNTSSNTLSNKQNFDAFIYIIVVLSFYALSMVLLMIKYIRREEEEISLDNFYTEFVKRDKFQDARYRNKFLLQKTTSSGVVERALKLTLGIRNKKDAAGALSDVEKTIGSVEFPKSVSKTSFVLTKQTISENRTEHKRLEDQGETLLETEV